jgi:hyperosmotically inducible protein
VNRFARLSVALAFGTAVSLVGLPVAADQPEDAYITTKVKMALLTDDTVDGLDIDVDTYAGKVTLHGKVDSSAEKTQAEALARKVKGVSEVRNLLTVVPPKAQDDVDVADDTLAGNVKAVLERDKALSGSEIRVKSVNNGVVVLSGKAKTLSAHRRALQDARAVPGVRQVASEIHSPDELADSEIWEEAHGAASNAGDAAYDAWITTKAKVQLMAEPGLSPFEVNVDTRDGIVSLFGRVSTQEVKNRATTQIRSLTGVKGVENDLQVVPDVAAKTVKANDAEVEGAVEERLESNASLDDADIDVAVKNGVARLTGTVSTQRDRFTALTLARATAGVGSVIDALEVKPQS